MEWCPDHIIEKIEMNTISESDLKELLKERLTLLFKQAALNIRLEEARKELEAAEHITQPTIAPARLIDNKPIPRIFKRADDLYSWLKDSIKYLNSHYGVIPQQAFANTSSASDQPASDRPFFCTWQQEHLQLTLSYEGPPEHTVELRVDGPIEAKLNQLCWITEGALPSNPDAPPELECFTLKRANESESTWKVEIKSGVFLRRLLTIDENRDNPLLLPFVEIR